MFEKATAAAVLLAEVIFYTGALLATTYILLAWIVYTSGQKRQDRRHEQRAGRVITIKKRKEKAACKTQN